MYSEQKQALAETQALKRPVVLAVSGVHNSGKTTLLEKLLPVLRPEETQVFKRGRNANPHSHPRGATRREYQVATGLEALFGWLYLRGETGRLNELFEMMMEGED